jgi:glutaredoxin
MTSSVVIYTKPNDPWSKNAKALLDRKGISYTENIVTDNASTVGNLESHQAVMSRANADTAAPGWQAKPIIVIDGETIVGLKALREKLGN